MFTILVAYRWNDRPRYVLASCSARSSASTALTRGEGVFLMVLLVLPLMLRQRELAMRDRWKQVLVTGVACLAVLAPWMVRNLVTFEEFVPLSTNGNEVLVYANCDDAYYGGGTRRSSAKSRRRYGNSRCGNRSGATHAALYRGGRQSEALRGVPAGPGRVGRSTRHRPGPATAGMHRAS